MRAGWTKQSELLTLNTKYSLHKRPSPRLEYILTEKELDSTSQRIHFHGDEYDSLLVTVYSAIKAPPETEQLAYVPVAVVEGRHGAMLVGWQPTEDGLELTISQGDDRILTVCEDDLPQWWEWLGQEAP